MKKLILLSILISNLCIADCTQSLSICANRVNLLEQDNAKLHQLVTLQEKQAQELKDLKTPASPVIPTWLWFVIGAAAGATIGGIVK